MTFSRGHAAELIRRLTPDVLVKGGDYRPEEVVGADWVLAHGGQVIIANTVEGFSTTGLLGGSGRSIRNDPPLTGDPPRG